MDEFTKISEDFKLYKEGIEYDKLSVTRVEFNADTLEMENYTNLTDIMKELSEISKKVLMYGIIYESQNQIVQQVEDMYNKWYATKYFEFEKEDEAIVDRQGNETGKKKVKQTESYIEKRIMTTYMAEYDYHNNLISVEKYKLNIIKRVVSSLENYGYKLHAMEKYNIASQYQKN